MRLETHNGAPIVNPDERKIDEVVMGLTSDDAFAVLSRDDMNYMQVAGSKSEGFTLEYQSGGTDKHFVAANGPYSAEQVSKALRLYAASDPRWQTDYPWEPMPL